MAPEIAVNLYSARHAMELDPDGTLARIAGAGYRNVEMAGYYGLTAPAFHDVLKKHGLQAVASHVPLVRFDDDLETVVAEAKQFGLHSLVVPWLNPERRQQDFIRALPILLNRWGKTVVQAGMRLAYHNHDFEYQIEVDGKLMMHLLEEDTHPDFVDFEPDLYWIAEAGHDPVAELRRLNPRVRLVHAKDRATDGSTVNVGSGILNWPAVVETSRNEMVDYLIVEHDHPADVVADLGASFAFLQGLLPG